MSVTKRISGNYTISSTNAGGTDQFTIANFATVTIDGNLLVLGNTVNVDTVNVSLGDQYITLNGNLPVSSAPTLNAGLQINRGNSANVWLIWNETVKKWQITNDGSTYGNIATGSTAIANLYADPSPTLSANLNLLGQQIYDSTTAVSIYTGAPNAGGSGIFVNNSANSGQELVTKSRVLAYSIIFG